MRGYRLLSTVAIAASTCLMQGDALAGSACEQSDSLALVAAPAPQAVPPVMPAATRAEAAPRVEREAGESGERTRIVSYLILRGLQGAGPFLGR